MKNNLKIKIFADGADIENIKTLCKNDLIKGFKSIFNEKERNY